MNKKRAVIIGAGPAGLTAGYELLHKTEIRPIVYEMSDDVGGISRTVVYKGNRIDIGGHRFFSKSERVMQWWLNILPLQGAPARDDKVMSAKSKRASTNAVAIIPPPIRASQVQPVPTRPMV